MFVANPYAHLASQIVVSERMIVVDGIQTRIWEYGDPTTPVDLVLIHGFRGDHHGLEPFVWHLGPQFHVLIPDLPGFGASAAFDENADIHAFARWLTCLWAVEKLTPRTTVLGHSFGSIVVSAAAAEGLPANKVILVNPIATNALKGPRGILTRLAVLYYKLATVLPEKMGYALLKNRAIVRIMSKTMAKTQHAPLLQWIHDQHDQYFSEFASRKSVLEAFEVSVSQDVSEFATQIHQSTLLIAADEDDITSIEKQHELVDKFDHAQLCVIPQVGHLVHYEAPDIAVEHIKTFLEQRPS